MRHCSPALYLLLFLGFHGKDASSESVGCEHEPPKDFSKLFEGYATQEERCLHCEAAMQLYRCRGFEYIYKAFMRMCENNQTPFGLDVKSCVDYLDSWVYDGRHLLWELKSTDPEFCRYALGCGKYSGSVYAWGIDIPTDPYPVNKTIESPAFSILHLTDTHILTEYAVGSSYSRGRELGCTGKQVRPQNLASAAGPYGDIRGDSLCDLPIRTLRSLLANANQRDFSYVYLTGDFMPHTEENYTLERIVAEMEEQTNIISEGVGGRKIFPNIGNHDNNPAFDFPTVEMRAGNHSIRRLYDGLWRAWGGKYIPAEAESTFRKGGFFSAVPHAGLRILSMNTNYCYKGNHWLIADPRDPAQQLQWMVSELEEAAQLGEKVHILGHVPPGTDECRIEWAAAYQKVIARFRNVITGQFFGHMHWDMFSVDFAPGTKVPTGVQFPAPSATTFQTGYPSYRIMAFGNRSELLDMDTYLLNITELNEDFMKVAGLGITVAKTVETLLNKLDVDDPSRTKWQLAYSYKDSYSMRDLSPASFVELIQRMARDDALLSKYYRAYFLHRHSPQEITCHKGVCEAIFYYERGSQHGVVCEMYSMGTEQRTECTEKLRTESESFASRARATLLLAIGGVLLTIISTNSSWSFR